MDEREPHIPMSERVNQEILLFAKQNNSEWDEAERLLNYLNNFASKIPDRNGITKLDRQASPFVREDQALKESEFRRTPYFHYGEGEIDDEKVLFLRKLGHSDRFILKTGEEFFDDVGKAIVAAGIDREALYAYLESLDQVGSGNGQKKDLPLIKTLLLPVFVKLREMGYSYTDLNI